MRGVFSIAGPIRIVFLQVLAVLCAATACSVPQEPSPRIIVSGASGQLGELIVEDLLARGVAPGNLILVSRTPEDLDRYAAMGATQAATLPEPAPSGETLSTQFRDLTGREGTTARQILEANREALLAARGN